MTFLYRGYMIRLGFRQGRRPTFSLTVTGLPFVPPTPPGDEGEWLSTDFSLASSSGALGGVF